MRWKQPTIVTPTGSLPDSDVGTPVTASGPDIEHKRQRVLAAFGEFALQSEDLDAVLTEACRLVSEALGTERAKVLEIQAGTHSLFVRAGVGWAPGIVGRRTCP
jgi:hypothetical protein